MAPTIPPVRRPTIGITLNGLRKYTPMMDVITYITTHFQEILAALGGLLSSLLVIAMLIPGEQPDKFLQSAVDFIVKFSRK